jgi:hypothetical protein
MLEVASLLQRVATAVTCLDRKIGLPASGVLQHQIQIGNLPKEGGSLNLGIRARSLLSVFYL